MSETSILDLDSLFDQKMSDVEAAPDFVNPPAGLYSLQIKECGPEKYKTKAKDGKPEEDKVRIKTLISVLATTELGDKSQPPVPNGSLFSIQNNADEDGKKYFKRFVMNVMNASEDDLKEATFKDMFDGMKDITFDAAITVTKTVNPAGGYYENVRVRPIHAPKS